MTLPLPPKEEKSDVETLKAWCHWKRLEKDVSEDDIEFVKAIENVISQVGTWKAKYERARAEERKRVEELVKAARFVLETLVPYSPISDEGIAMEKLRNALTSYRREGGG